MTYNKSEIMKNAWEIARKNAAKESRRSGKKISANSQMWWGLRCAWDDAKQEMQESVAQEAAAKKAATSSKKRYIELASVAEKNNLNHGKTWIADGYNVDKNSLHPSWEGETVCYVYAA